MMKRGKGSKRKIRKRNKEEKSKEERTFHPNNVAARSYREASNVNNNKKPLLRLRFLKSVFRRELIVLPIIGCDPWLNE